MVRFAIIRRSCVKLSTPSSTRCRFIVGQVCRAVVIIVLRVIHSPMGRFDRQRFLGVKSEVLLLDFLNSFRVLRGYLRSVVIDVQCKYLWISFILAELYSRLLFARLLLNLIAWLLFRVVLRLLLDLYKIIHFFGVLVVVTIGSLAALEGSLGLLFNYF